MSRIAILSLAALLSGLNAQAAPFCPSFADLKLNMRDCDDNFALSKRADACLSLFTTEIIALRGQLDKQLKGEAEKGKAEQSGTLSTTGSMLDRTVQELDRVIGNGEIAKAAVGSYKNNLSLPEDYDQPGLLGMSTAKYLSVEPCYATPKRIVDENIAVLNLMVDDLRKTRKEVASKSGAVKAESTDFSSTGNAPKLQGQKPGNLPPVIQGEDRKSIDSGVSGMEKQKKREDSK